jgi:hypothetical protein
MPILLLLRTMVEARRPLKALPRGSVDWLWGTLNHTTGTLLDRDANFLMRCTATDEGSSGCAHQHKSADCCCNQYGDAGIPLVSF